MSDFSYARVSQPFDAFREHADALRFFNRLFAVIRPRRASDAAEAEANFSVLMDFLEQDDARCDLLRQALQGLISQRRLVGFFSDSGILPATGFISELARIVAHRILPDIADPNEFRDCIHIVFNRADDWVWLSAISPQDSLRFWNALVDKASLPSGAGHVTRQLTEAVLVLAYRLSGFDLEREFGRLGPSVAGYAPAFRAVAGEAQGYVDGWLSEDETQPDAAHLHVLIEQCQQMIDHAHKAAMKVGTSLALTFALRRAEQSLARLSLLVSLLSTYGPGGNREKTIPYLAQLMRGAVRAEVQRNNIAKHISRGMSFLALRITDNAAKSGEHYVTETRAAYFAMWRSAMGAGVIIAVMALIKIFTAKLALAPFGYAFCYSMIYGLGFVLIYMLHLTIATKQPAMTAQTIAGYLGQAGDGKLENIERVVDLVAAVVRSQIAAILGNVAVALPTAMLIAVGWQYAFGIPVIDVSKGAHLLADINPLGWALPYAAVAGVFLFFSGIISGYFDNLASYARIGERVARLPWLNRLVGNERAGCVGTYLDANLGGISGNFMFGCMLGSAATIGMIFGLPLDIRHIAFSSANLGYAIAAFDFSLLPITIAWASLGVLLIGFVNLTVSFVLALWMALRARNVIFSQTPELLRALWQRLRTAPHSFFIAPAAEVDAKDALVKS